MKTVALFVLIFLLGANAQNYFFGCKLVASTFPTMVTSSGTGAVACYYYDQDGVATLNCAYTYSGLNSNAFVAHWHVGSVGTTGNVTFTFAAPSGTSGTYLSNANEWQASDIGGNWVPSPIGTSFASQIQMCATGGCYFNLHTATNPTGELRCQAHFFEATDSDSGPLLLTPGLPSGTATGMYTVVKGGAPASPTTDGIRAWAYHVEWTGLTSNVLASHIHLATGAAPTQTGPVVVNFQTGGSARLAASGSFSGVALLCTSDYQAYVNATGLLYGFAYVNLHTVQNGGGELRSNFVFNPQNTVDPADDCSSSSAFAPAMFVYAFVAFVAIAKIFA